MAIRAIAGEKRGGVYDLGECGRLDHGCESSEDAASDSTQEGAGSDTFEANHSARALLPDSSA